MNKKYLLAYLIGFIVIIAYNLIFNNINFNKKTDKNLLPEINKNTILLDVRTKTEFENENIAGSINIPLDIIEKNFENLNKKDTIFVFCQSGVRALKAKSILENNGFEHIFNAESIDNIKTLLKK